MPRFVVLDLMRWLLAVLVAAMHLRGFVAPPKAYLAVDFFFILSGFVLTGAYMRKAHGASFIKDYLTDRLARLYPLHLATLLLLVPINLLFWLSTNQYLENTWSYSDGRPYTFVLHLILLQNVGLTSDSSWNAPSWSISVEFVINIALALVLARLAKARNAALGLLAVAVACYVILFNSIGNLAAFTETVFGLINTGLLRGAAGISLGVLAWLVFAKTKDIFPAPTVFAAASTGAFLLLMLVWHETKHVDFLVIPIIFLSVLSIATAEHRHPLQEGRITTIFLTLGASSYAVYLIHWPIIAFIRYQLMYAWGLPINIENPFVTALILTMVCVTAVPVYARFELPAKRKFKDWLRRL